MDAAVLDLIEVELIHLKEERARLKDKKANLERIRAALKSKGASSTTQIITNVKKENKRKERDPNKPKRPQSAYNLFYQDKAQLFKEQNPNVPQKDIMSIIGPTWKECPPNEKAAYESKARDLKAEFDRKLQAYHAMKQADTAGNSSSGAYHNDEDDEDSEEENMKKKKREK